MFKHFTWLLHVSMYTKLQNYVQLSLALTNLCDINSDYLANFYFALEK